MFSLSYIAAELRRRGGRTVLTALGLGVGVALVVAVTALSRGLDEAQRKVLEPLTGVGTDLSATRPLKGGPGGFANLSAAERRQLERENGGGRIGLQSLGRPGERFSTDRFMAMTQLSFPASVVRRVAGDRRVGAVAGGLTLQVVHLQGRVPREQPDAVMGEAPAPSRQRSGGPRTINLQPVSITGVDTSTRALGPIGPASIVRGRFLRGGDAREVVLNVAYARRKGLAVGDTVRLGGHRYEIVGLARTPLGGTASDQYVDLRQLQEMSGRRGRINVLYVRARSSDDVAAVKATIGGALDGAEVTTAADLAERVGGSLVDACRLAGKLGTALAVIGLLAAFGIAALLTLASVTKRVRELGTLKALGWPRRMVVRQVAGESLVQGLLGGVAGVVLGVAAAAAISAAAPSLRATVSGTTADGPLGFGQGRVSGGSTSVALEAPVDLRLIALAVALALAGGLLAGALGGLRAARLQPAAALRHVD